MKNAIFVVTLIALALVIAIGGVYLDHRRRNETPDMVFKIGETPICGSDRNPCTTGTKPTDRTQPR